MKNKKLMMVGLIIILLVGIVSVFAMGKQHQSWYGHKDWTKIEKYSHKNFEDKSVWLEKMGLPLNATNTQIIEAKKEFWDQDKIGQKWEEKKNFHKGSGFHKKSWCGKS